MPADHVEDLRHLIKTNGLLVVVGAGVSMAATKGAKTASWIGLLKDGVQNCPEKYIPKDWGGKDGATARLESKKIDDLLEVAEVVSEGLGAPGVRFRAWLKDAVGALEVQEVSVLNALRDLGVPIVTTNYDGLLEKATGRPHATWRDRRKVEDILKGRHEAILHLHGHYDDPDSVILGIRSYEKVVGDGHAQATLRALLATKNLLFIGFGGGLDDPNFKALTDWARDVYKDSKNPHYRLGIKDEVDASQKANPDETLFLPVSYGSEWDHLADFLVSLAPAPRGSAGVVPELPAKPPHFGLEKKVGMLVKAFLSGTPEPTPVLGGMGHGKTTITKVALHDPEVCKRFGDRRYFAYCEGAKSKDGLAMAIAVAIGTDIQGQNLVARLKADLGANPAVLVLDNAETPWEADPDEVQEFLASLAAIPNLALAASFRGLGYPAKYSRRDPIKVEPLGLDDARDAFVNEASGKFRDDPDLDTLLGRLAGIPLAIVLTAYVARPEHCLKGVLERWEKERTAMLKRPGKKERETDFDASLALSVNNPKMDADGRRLLALLGEFPAGFANRDLDAILPGGVAARARHNLMELGLAFDEAGRLRVLPPIRDYLGNNLAPTAADRDHAIDHFLVLAANEGGLVGRSLGADAARRLASEIPNIDHAAGLGLTRLDASSAIDAVLGMAELSRFTGEGTTTLLERARQVAHDRSEGRLEAMCLLALGHIALARSRHDEAARLLGEARPMFHHAGVVLGEAQCILSLSEIALGRSRHDGATRLLGEARPMFRDVDDLLGEANCILILSEIALRRSRHDEATRLLGEARSMFHHAGVVLGEANCIRSLGEIALRRARHDEAGRLFGEARPMYRSVGDLLGEANCVRSLGDVAVRGSRHGEAARLYGEARPMFHDIGNVLGEANCILSLGDVAVRDSRHDEAGRLFVEARSMYRGLGDVNGEASCIHGLGDIAAKEGRPEEARERFEEALRLYGQIPEPYSFGRMHRRLARIARGQG